MRATDRLMEVATILEDNYSDELSREVSEAVHEIRQMNIPNEFMKQVGRSVNYGVVFRTDRFGDRDPREHEELAYDAVIEMETFPVWPGLFTRMIFQDGERVWPNHGERFEEGTLARVTRLEGFQGSTNFVMEFESDHEGHGFEYEQKNLLNEDEWGEHYDGTREGVIRWFEERCR